MNDEYNKKFKFNFRYEDLSALGLPANYKVASAKYKKESLANPQIRLFNPSNFAGQKFAINS